MIGQEYLLRHAEKQWQQPLYLEPSLGSQFCAQYCVEFVCNTCRHKHYKHKNPKNRMYISIYGEFKELKHKFRFLGEI